jgi:hypothetical protein
MYQLSLSTVQRTAFSNLRNYYLSVVLTVLATVREKQGLQYCFLRDWWQGYFILFGVTPVLLPATGIPKATFTTVFRQCTQ